MPGPQSLCCRPCRGDTRASFGRVPGVGWAALWIVLGCQPLVLLADDWPQWRGPNRTGRVAVEDWEPKTLQVLWRAEVGIGFSSLSIADGRLITLGHVEGRETIWCLDARTGELIWKQSYEADLAPHLFEGGPTSTPTIVDGLVYTISRQGVVHCLDAVTGEARWSLNIAEQCELNVPTWGFSGSPCVVKEAVIFNAGHSGVALDKKTGQVLWQSDNHEEAGYASPLPIELGGDSLVLISSAKHLNGVDPKTGKRVWEFRWITRYGVNAADPIPWGERIFLSSGYGKGTALLDLSSGEPKQLWRTRDLRNQMSPGILVDGHVYAVDGDAGNDPELKCVAFDTGKVAWSEGGLGSATLIGVGRQLVLLSESGELLIAKADPKRFDPTKRLKVLNNKCWTAPAFADRKIYCRDASGQVVCVGGRDIP